MNEELKPCPYCGGEAYLNECPNCGELNMEVYHKEGCWMREYEGEYDLPGNEKEQYIAAWNRRAERTCKREWRNNPWGGYTEHCGACGADFGCDTRNRQNYCPNCGAKVVE